MFLKPKDRKLIRNSLLIINIILAFILLSLLFSGILIIRPKLIQRASSLGQFLSLDLNHLPQGLDTIEPDYLGKEREINPTSGEDYSLNHKSKPALGILSANPKIAIIITNLGLNKRIDDYALKLPSEISYGIIPYSNRTRTFINDAQGRHEIYLYLPLWEGDNIINLEKNLLAPNCGIEENTTRLSSLLNSYNNFSGVYSNLKEIFTNDVSAFQPLLAQIENKNLIFVQGKVGNALSEEQSLNSNNLIRTSIVIDSEADEKEIRKNLNQLIENAKSNGNALGYANGYVLTIELLNEWLPTLKVSGVELVPVSHLIKEGEM